ncbi:MAG: DUF885 family protein [Fimbriimonadaceae bacterium]|nr:MAG: DUF885 family protein [Fimbriimonadaceae bacterium]
MIQLMERYSADLSALNRLHNFPESSSKITAFSKYIDSTEAELNAKNFKNLSPSERADWHLMKIELDEQRFELSELKKNLAESSFLVPFMSEIVKFHDHRISRTLPNSEQFAADLAHLESSIKAAHGSIKDQLKTKKPGEVAPEHVVLRTVSTLRNSKSALESWHEHFAGYDPMFTWWTKRPYEDVVKALDSYSSFLRSELTGRDADPNRIVGDPVGREALVAALRREMIDYTPEELIAIAEKEMAWVDAEFKKAANQLGYGDDWRAALEHVKTLHEKPGDQPKLIRELAEEAIDYLEKNDLLTIPPLAKDVWRMDMMSPERQLVSPFFLGGESILISFPTDEMTHEQKLMSLRANNRYFAKATVHHELIPGHHMQQFMTSRYNTHRSGISYTPFWTEGWALYWEFLLYKRGFAATPEDKIGFLFWRKHRCARIIFSLKFHLGQMTAQECIDMLINQVGHEKSTAEGEVRRSFGGSYPPLYQAAYMLGAFQLWQIRRELVETGKMPEKQFHDEILKLGNMPWAVVRKLLSGEEITEELKPWKFYSGSIN